MHKCKYIERTYPFTNAYYFENIFYNCCIGAGKDSSIMTQRTHLRDIGEQINLYQKS